MRYTITDLITGIVHKGIDRYDVATTLRGLYPDAPAEVHLACHDLEAKLHRGVDFSGEEAYLQVLVTR